MKKIKVKICAGTACYVMGASHLLSLKDFLGDLSEIVEIEATNCLGKCKDGSVGNAPFVLVDDELITEATIEKVINHIKKHRGDKADG